MVPLASVAEIVTGSTPSTARPDFYGGPIPFVGPADLGTAEPICRADKTLTPAGAEHARVVPPEAVLVCCIGATIGKVGWAGTALATNQQINSVVFNGTSVFPRYGFHFCRTLEPLLRHHGSSTTLPIISKGRFQELPMPLPPLDEQMHIATVLDKVDAIRNKRRESIALSEALVRSTFIEMFGDPVENPRHWPVAFLGDVAEAASGVTKGKRYEDQRLVTLPYMRVANVQDGHLVLDEVKTISVSEDDARRYELKSGDVLLTEGGDPDKLGRGAVWREEITPCIHQNHIFRVRPGEQLRSEYLSAIAGSERGKRYFMRAAKQTTGIATINMSQLRAFPVPIPPLELQDRYVRFLQRADVMRAVLRRRSEIVEELFLSLMSRAFSGELRNEHRAAAC